MSDVTQRPASSAALLAHTPCRRPLTTRLLTAVVVAAIVVALVGPAAVPAGAGGDPLGPPVSTTTVPESGGIIPRPNSGEAPTDAGDRGGILQGAVFFGIVAALGVIAVLVVRQSRKAREDRGF